MALAGHADHVAGFLRNLLESSHIVSGRNLLPLGEIHTLARELNVRITHGMSRMDRGRGLEDQIAARSYLSDFINRVAQHTPTSRHRPPRW